MSNQSIYDFTVADSGGNPVSLEDYRGKVLLIVNTASKCGFTPQYTQLQELYDQYSARGLVVLALPCNQFGGQEPGSNAEVQEFDGDTRLSPAETAAVVRHMTKEEET